MNVAQRTLWCLLSLTLLVSPLAQAGVAKAAQPQDAVAVVSLVGSDQLLKELNYLTESAGAADVGHLISLMAGPYTANLDKSKAAGLYVVKEGDAEFGAIAFVPVKDLSKLLADLEPQIGKPQDAGDDVLEIASDKPNPAFVKQKGKWAFLSDKKDRLGTLPDDPTKLLGGLDQKYTLAVRLNLAKLPAEWRQTAIEQMRKGFEEGTEKVNEDERAQVKQLGEAFVSQLVRLIEDTEQLTLGWKIDAAKQKTFLEVGITATAGSELAEQMALVRNQKSNFAGFRQPGAAMTLTVTGQSTPKEIEQAQQMMGAFREAAMKGIADDEKLADDADRKAAEEIVGKFLDLVEETVKVGKTDMGAVVVMKPDGVNAAAGGLVADGQKLAEAIQDAAKFAKEKNPEVPDINFDALTYKGVTFHTVAIPLPPSEQAQQLIGDSLQLIVGTGEKSAYVAVGKDPESLLKQIIDKSATDANKQLPPLEFVLALTPIVEVVASLADNPQVAAILEILQKAKDADHIVVRTTPIERGALCRLELEGGVLRVIGEGVRVVGPMVQAAFPH